MSKIDDKIFETKMIVFTRDNFKCQYEGCNVCGIDNLECAHKIGRTVANRNHVMRYVHKNFGEVLTFKEAYCILNHPDNMITSCKKHNDYFSINNHPLEKDELIRKIYKKLHWYNYESCE